MCDRWLITVKAINGRWKKAGKPNEGKMIPTSYLKCLELWRKISKRLGKQFQPHDCRRSPSGWLRDLGLSDLAIGQYDQNSGEGVGFTGVGWENAEIYYTRYGKINPIAIYDKKTKTRHQHLRWANS